jgi:hypothetical protein
LQTDKRKEWLEKVVDPLSEFKIQFFQKEMWGSQPKGFLSLEKDHSPPSTLLGHPFLAAHRLDILILHTLSTYHAQ